MIPSRVFATLLVMRGIAELQASSDLSSDVKSTPPVRVTFETRLNVTGHWISQIGLEHKKWTGSMRMDTTVTENSDTIQVVATISRSPPKPVLPGYEAVAGVGSYKFHAVGGTWAQARDSCSAEGSHLIIINSDKEAGVVVWLFARNPTVTNAENSGWAWTGVRELGVNEQYYTLFGDALATTGYSRWIPQKHNITGVDNCVLTERGTGSLTDYFCHNRFGYICEQELN